MARPILVIINGLPATGKTSLSKRLAKKLDLPLLSKDTIKEMLFDNLGIADRDWSKVLGSLAGDFQFDVARRLLSENRSIMIESAFYAEIATPKVQALISDFGVSVFEVYCVCESEIRSKRFIERVELGMRHPGHVDGVTSDPRTEEDVLKTYAPLNLGGLYTFDATDISDQKVEEAVEEIASLILAAETI